MIIALAGGSLDAMAQQKGRSIAADELTLRQSARQTVQAVWQGAQDVALYALGMIGVDYRYGGDSPERGLDCSGLIRYVFQEVTGVTLPRTVKEMSRLGHRVSADDLKPGDLVFFNTRRFPFSHVGLYLGNDRFIHAPSRGREVEVVALNDSYWQRHFNGARRLVGVVPSLIPSVIPMAYADTLPASANVGLTDVPTPVSPNAALTGDAIATSSKTLSDPLLPAVLP